MGKYVKKRQKEEIERTEGVDFLYKIELLKSSDQRKA